jgi:Flp pilus assembly protein TadG
MKLKRNSQRLMRRGAITILAAVLSIVMLGMVAFCVDLGYILSAKEEMQRTADASALAACWEFGQQLANGYDATGASGMARSTAVEYANLNKVTGKGMIVDANTANDPAGDVTFGYVSDFSSSADMFTTGTASQYNAVRVRVHKDSSVNGEVPYFFAKIFGLDGQVLHSEATAAIVRSIKGFQSPSDGGNLDLLPFTLDIDTWQDLVDGNSTDQYAWNSETHQVQPGADGWVEVNLFPQGTGSPGNRGTVDIGGSNNSTADIARQILQGVSEADLAHHGGSLQFDSEGKLYLNGDTGISAGVKDELSSIIGQPRIIPIFESVTGNGNNAMYTIVKWQGICITYVKLTGSMSQKRVMIQVAPVLTKGVIPSTTTGDSEYVFSPVVLVR